MEKIKNTFSLVLFYLSIVFVNSSHAQTFEQCNKIASEVNKICPMKVDKITTAKSVVCFPKKNKIIFTYFMEVDINEGSSLNQNALDAYRPNIVKMWCTDPSQLVLLKIYPIQYKYSFNTGQFIVEINFSLNDCS